MFPFLRGESGMPRLLNNPAHWRLRAQEARFLARRAEVASVGKVDNSHVARRPSARCWRMSEIAPDPPEMPCPACGSTVKLCRIVPKLGGLPELRTFQCVDCEEVVTIEAE